MEKIEVMLRVSEGQVFVPGYQSDTLGIAVHRQLADVQEGIPVLMPREWAITHQQSGLYIAGHYPTRKESNRIAINLGKIGDFTKPMSTMQGWPKSKWRLARDIIRGGGA